MKKVLNNKYFLPYYNEKKQVSNCTSYHIGQEVKDTKIYLSIGHNGKEFISSTDWISTDADEEEYVLPFCAQAQNPTFLTLQAGVNYTVNELKILEAKADYKKTVLVMPDEQTYEFAPGEPVRVLISEGCERFIASDCAVKIEETEETRTYFVLTEEDTKYASYMEYKVSAQ